MTDTEKKDIKDPTNLHRQANGFFAITAETLTLHLTPVPQACTTANAHPFSLTLSEKAVDTARRINAVERGRPAPDRLHHQPLSPTSCISAGWSPATSSTSSWDSSVTSQTELGMKSEHGIGQTHHS